MKKRMQKTAFSMVDRVIKKDRKIALVHGRPHALQKAI